VSAVVSLTLRAVAGLGGGGLRGYAGALRAACAASPPPFGLFWYGQKFRSLARDPHWLALALVQNGAKEGEGARKLWRLGGRTGDALVAEQIRQHAVDESRHALLYVAMLETVFPHAVPAELRPQLIKLSPRYRAGDRLPSRSPLPWRRVLDELIQMNLGEIRTRINQALLGPVVTAYCPAAGRRRLRRILRSLMDDETRHVAYTARILERAIWEGRGEFVRRTMMHRLVQFNRLTMHEVGGDRYGAT
jgi:hypothetical protein